MNNKDLIQSLIEGGWLKSERVISSFQKVKREDFVPENLSGLAYLNKPLSIGWGQTISQPLVVAIMLEMLDVEEGDKIMDIGSGSGWATALMGVLSGSGRVFGVEVVPELVEFGKKNISKYNNVEIRRGNGREGLEEEAPFDKILVSAETDKIERSWKDQLRVGGRMVVPLGSSLTLVEKVGDNEFNKKKKEGFMFVPLIK